MQTAHCRFCNELVIWATTENGKKVPLEPGAGWGGTYRVAEGQDGSVHAKRIPAGSPPSPDRYRTHLATCTKRPRKTKR